MSDDTGMTRSNGLAPTTVPILVRPLAANRSVYPQSWL